MIGRRLEDEAVNPERITHGARQYAKNPDEMRIYWIWAAMVQRCTNKANPHYENYGARGIYVCDRWRSYSFFRRDMGARPTRWHTLERLDNNAGYCRSNCVWASRAQNNLNKRKYKNNKTGVTGVEARENGSYRVRIRRSGKLVINKTVSTYSEAMRLAVAITSKGKHMEQGTSAWHSARCGKFTASRFSDLMARGRSGVSASRGALLATLAIERLTGLATETYQNDAMRRGVELESEARRAYEKRKGILVEEVGFIPHPDLPFVGCSPDAMVGGNGLAEFKAPFNPAKHVDALRTGAHAKEYYWQLQGQLMVTGRQWVDAVSYDPRFPEGLQLAIHRVFRDEKAIAELRVACAEAHLEVQAILSDLLALRGAV
jgi:hypothetical protein